MKSTLHRRLEIMKITRFLDKTLLVEIIFTHHLNRIKNYQNTFNTSHGR